MTTLTTSEDKIGESEKKRALAWSINYIVNKKGLAFYGHILQCLTINYSEAVPTAGVRYSPKAKSFYMLINPTYFCRTLDDKERAAVLLHEIKHIAHRHVFMNPHAYGNNPMKLNIAMDLAINQFIQDLPKGALHLKDFKDNTGTQFPPNCPLETYYNLLDKSKYNKDNGQGEGEGQPQQGEGDGQGEPQQGQGSSSPGNWVDSKELYKTYEFDKHDWNAEDGKEKMEAVKDLIKRTMNKTCFGHTQTPTEIEDLLEEIKAELKKLDYKAILMRTLKKSLPSKDFVSTWKKPNRRYGELARGKMGGHQPRIEVFIDTSGSISIEEANKFLAITNNFLTVGVDKANVNLFHTSVYHTEKVKKNFKLSPDVFKSGGTDLQDCFDKLKKTRCDLAIVITDGYYSRPDINTKTLPNLVYIISEGGAEEHPLKDTGYTVKAS